MSASVDLSIVIVAWNVRDLVLDCLASIRAAKVGVSHEVILVDNGSIDFTVEAVSRQFPGAASRCPRTSAKAGTCGPEVMRGRHAVLLNPTRSGGSRPVRYLTSTRAWESGRVGTRITAN
jgi:GT2 family glycosyltransferase